jgi:hypothetical protein
MVGRAGRAVQRGAALHLVDQLERRNAFAESGSRQYALKNTSRALLEVNRSLPTENVTWNWSGMNTSTS